MACDDAEDLPQPGVAGLREKTGVPGVYLWAVAAHALN
jgi:hypothetical protein